MSKAIRQVADNRPNLTHNRPNQAETWLSVAHDNGHLRACPNVGTPKPTQTRTSCGFVDDLLCDVVNRDGCLEILELGLGSAAF